MKQPRERVEEGLHPIENEKRPRVVAKKRGGLRLKAKYHRRITKVLASFSAAAVLCLGVFGVNALFFKDSAPNVVDEGFVTVAYDLPTDGSTPDMHSALENIGYMNTRLMGQENYYAEMHGLVDTMIKQQVSTYKQFGDGVLVQTDITTSSMVNSARQFCYVGDRVLWRDAAGGPSTYDGVNTEWKTGDPYGNMLIEDFKKTKGLPGTSFSVYVINEETLLGADPVVVNADGTYSQTYYLDPATDKAPAYYVNQMMFTGGLTALPSFEYITVTYTFDSTWQVLQSVIDEKYTATMGVSVGCTASYTTDYEYGTEKADSDAYETYFKNYADKPATGAPEGSTVTAAGCLSNAFAPVLSGPVTFALDLTIDGAPVSGLVYVNAADMANMELRAQLGNIFVSYAGGELRLAYGNGVKVSADAKELLALVQSFLPAGGSEGISLDTDELLAQLGGGDFAVSDDGRSATLDSELELMGLSLPVHFEFLIAEDGTITLGHISADMSLGGVGVSARLAYSDESVPAPDGEYASLLPYVETVLGIMKSDVLAVSVDYAGNGFSVGGTVNVNISDLNALSAQGTLTLAVGGAEKEIGIAYTGGYAYIDLDGVKIRADVQEAVALVMQFIGGEAPAVDTGDFALGDLLTTILSDDFAENISLAEKENALEIVLAGNELLKALGVNLSDFALGNVALSVADGALSVNALGAQLSVTTGKAFSVDTEGYTDILPMVNELIALFSNENLQADVRYAAGDLTVKGNVKLNVNTLAAAGELTLGYKGREKRVAVIYGDGLLGLDIDGIKVKANVAEAVSLITDLLGAESGLSAAENDLLMQVLSLDFDSLIDFENESSVVVKGTELLKAFGIDFALGDVRLTVKDGSLTAEVLGATATVTGAAAFEAVITDEYTDILPYAEALIAFFTDAEYLRADIDYAAGDLTAEGYVNLSLRELAVQGEVTIGYNGAALPVGLIYKDGALYLDIRGLKVKANAAEAMELVTELLGADMSGLTQGEKDILETLFSLDFGKLIELDDTNALTVNVKGTELLKAFGIDFELGDVSLTVSSEKIAAGVLGAELTVTKTKEFSVDTEGYTDILPMVNELIALFGNENLQADVHYAAGDLTVNGNVKLNVNTLAAAGDLALGYKGKTKAVGVIYGDGVLGLDIDGIKVKANVAEAVSLITDLLGAKGGLSAAENDLLMQVLALDFGSLIDFENESSVVVKGTELLKAFGIDFALGDVRLTVKDGSLTAEVLGATATVTGAEAFEAVITDEYTDILPYAEALIAFFTDAEYLRADIDYAAGDLTAEGYVNLSLKEFAVQGEVTVGYNGAALPVGLIYKDGALYLDIRGLKVKADAAEAMELVTELLGADMNGLTQGEKDILETLFSLDFGKLIELDDTNALTVNVKGTELLKAFGIDFELGDVSLTVSSEKIAAGVLGAELTVTKTTEFATDTEGYTDILPFAQTVLGIVAESGIDVQAQFAAGGVTLLANVSVSLEEFAAEGDLTVTYTDNNGSASKKIGFAYGADGYIFLTIEGAKLKLNAADAVGLVSSVVGAQDGSEVSELLKNLFSLDFGEVIRFRSETSAVIGGTQILAALGVDFALGDIALNLQDGKLTAEVQGEDALLDGLQIVLAKGGAFALDPQKYAGYADITPVLETVLTIIENQAIALSGTLNVAYKDLAAAVSVQNGTVSWKDGLRLSLDLIVTVDETAQKIGVYADETRIRIVYGSVGVDLVYDELYTVGNAFEALYERVAAILSGYVKGAQIPATMEEISALAGAGAALTDLFAGLDIPQLIGGVTFGAPQKGGVATVSYGSICAELFVSRGAVSVEIGKTSTGEVAFSGALTAGVSDGAVAEPSGDYMTAADLCEFLDFVGAAAATLSSNDVRMNFDDSLAVNTDGSAKFEIDGEIVYHAGGAGETLFTLDTAAQTLVVNPEAYVYFKLWLDEVSADGTDLFFEFWMFDYEQDGELDFFVSLSKYQPEDSRYQPLNFAVSASDLLTIAASGVSLIEDTLANFLTTLGIPEETTSALFEVLDSYFVSKWLSPDEKGQFGAVGGMLMETLGVKAAIDGMLGDVSDAIAGETVLADMPFDYYLKKLGISAENGETVFTVALDSDLVYGGEGLDDLTIIFRKNGEAGSSFLSGISIANIYGAGNADKTSVHFDIGYEALSLGYTESGVTLSAGEAVIASLSYAGYANYMFEGADELLKSVALSATHKEGEDHKLNDSFYISGTVDANLNLGIIKPTVSGVGVAIGVTVSEAGEVVLNLRLSYSSFPLVISHSGVTELTVKGGMAYLRRTLEGEQPEYRVMTLENFFSGLLTEYLAYMLDFSDLVSDAIAGAVSGGDDGGETQTDDYGPVLGNVLNSYGYAQGTNGSTWMLNLNGDKLTDGAFGDLLITLVSENYNGLDNVLRKITFNTSLYSIVELDGTLTFNDACGVSDGTEQITEDISVGIPDLYTVTIVAPYALGSDWEKNEDGTYSAAVQMFANSSISLMYGENRYVFTVTAENTVFDLTELEGLPQNMLWEKGLFEYTANDSSIRIPLAPDTVTYRSSGVNFTLGEAENVSETTVEFDSAYTLETPAAEGYTFLGWYVLDENGNPVRVTDVSYSVVGGVNTTVEALWASDLVFDSVETSDTQRDWVAWHRTFSVNVAVSGGELSGAYAEADGITVYTKYTFTLKGTAYSDDIGYVEGDGFLASASCSKDGNSAANRKYEIAVELIYSCGGNELGRATATTSKGF